MINGKTWVCIYVVVAAKIAEICGPVGGSLVQWRPAEYHQPVNVEIFPTNDIAIILEVRNNFVVAHHSMQPRWSPYNTHIDPSSPELLGKHPTTQGNTHSVDNTLSM